MAAPGYGALLDQLRGVTWPARRAALAGTAGTHVSHLRGLSAEFTEYRPYRQGDDPRRLDWKLLARTDRAWLRITNDQATLGTTVLLDASASMRFPDADAGKWVQACRLAVGLAAVAHAAGDPVGLVIGGGDAAVRLPPRTRRGVVAELARALAEARPGGSAPLAPSAALLRGTPRVVLVGDGLGDADAVRAEAKTLVAGGTEVHVVHVVAVEELAPAGRAIMATDPEDGAIRRALLPESHDAYRTAFGAWRRAEAWRWRAAGAAWTEVLTDEPAARAIRRIVAPRPGGRP